MPIKIPEKLPAREILRNENVFVMDESKAFRQDILSLEVVILNLMPKKQTTEVQLLRLIGNTPLQVNVTFLHMATHVSKTTPQSHLSAFYKVFDDVCGKRYDGMIITGAPIETISFEEVTYWRELVEIMDWTLSNVTSTLHICWGAQAGLYHHYGIKKHPLQEKMFGVFHHKRLRGDMDILRGFDDIFLVPHSRHTEIRKQDILDSGSLVLLSESDIAGVYMVGSKDGQKQIFITGHSEYDPLTLKDEYDRDIAKGYDIEPPINYFPEGNPAKTPIVSWRAHANLLFGNWLNYCVIPCTGIETNARAELSVAANGKLGI